MMREVYSNFDDVTRLIMNREELPTRIKKLRYFLCDSHVFFCLFFFFWLKKLCFVFFFFFFFFCPRTPVSFGLTIFVG